MKAVEAIPVFGGGIGLFLEGALFTRKVAKLKGERDALIAQQR